MRRGEVLVSQIAAIGGLVLIEANAIRLPLPVPASTAVADIGLLLVFGVLWQGVARAARSVIPVSHLQPSDIPEISGVTESLRGDHGVDRQHGVDRRPRAERSRRIYWAGVAVAVVAVWVGGMVLGRDQFVPWILAVMGVHFLPAAAAFRATAFRWVGWVLIGLGAAGGTLAVAVDGSAAAVAAVLAGFTLYALCAGWFGPASGVAATR